MVVRAEPRTRKPEHAVARAICTFPEGATRRLYATELSLGGAFILAMRPPSVGSLLTVTLHPLGHPPLSTLESRVIGLRIDPDDAERTGFEVVFTHVGDAALAELAHVVERLDAEHPPRRRRAHRPGELRLAPRIATDLLVVVEMDGQSDRPMRILNISMTGALIGATAGLDLSQASIAPGVELRVTIVHPNAPESINLRAAVVRRTAPPEPSGFAVRFIAVGTADALRLEGLLLDCLVRPTTW